MANHDRFGNLIDDKGHDILDDEELADLDEVRYLDDEDDDFDLFSADWDDDGFEEEYYEESYMTGDSDLTNEY